MVTLAFLGSQYGAQVATNPDALAGVDVVWQGDALADLVRTGADLRPEVLVADLDLLGPSPTTALEGLRKALAPELSLLVYSYAKRNLVSSLQDQSTRVLQGPLNLGALRSQILGLIVRDMLGTEGGGSMVDCPRCGSTVERRKLTAR